MATDKSKTLINEDAELFIAQQDYEGKSADEIDLLKGDVVEILDTIDTSVPKKPKLDPELDEVDPGNGLLDSSAAKHKLSVRPKRKYRDTRQTNININTRWKIRIVSSSSKKSKVGADGWVPTLLLRPADEPGTAGGQPPPDTPYRRDAVIRELIDTEEEFCQDLRDVLERYYFPLASDAKLGNARPPKCVRDNHELIFGNLKLIADFHNTVLMEGVKYYASEPVMLGRVFLRLERDFDKHVSYCRDEPLAQHFLQSNLEAKDYFMEVSQRLGDDKTLSEHLKLPIQRINDYQLLLKELVKYTCWLNEDASYLQRALELMLSVPHRAIDDKFTSNIEGFRGSIHKLGRLLAHDWYSITKTPATGEVTTPEQLKKERYLFLFKARILVCKVKRISEDRSVFQLKDIIKLPNVEVRDFPEEPRIFQLYHANTPGYPLTLTAHRDLVKLYWLDEIRQYSSDIVALEEHAADDLQVEEIPPPKSVTSTTSYKTAVEDNTVSEDQSKLKETVLSEAQTVIVEAKRAIVIPVTPEPVLSAEVKVVDDKSTKTTPATPNKPLVETKPVEANPQPNPNNTPNPNKTLVETKVETKPTVPNLPPATKPIVENNPKSLVEAKVEPKPTAANPSPATNPSVENNPNKPLLETKVETKPNVANPPPTTKPSVENNPKPLVETKIDKEPTLANPSLITNPSVQNNPSPQVPSNPTSNPSNPQPKPVESAVSSENKPSTPGESSEEMSRRYGSISSSAARSEYREESSSSFTSVTTNGREAVSEVRHSAAVSASSEIRRDGAIVASETVGYVAQGEEVRKDGVIVSSQQSVSAIGDGGVQSSAQKQITSSVSENKETATISKKVNGKPIFVKTIEGCNVEPGETAEFNCTLGGGRTDSLTWLKDNKPLSESIADRAVATASDAGDSFSLRILKCLASDSGTYTALAFNADGKSTCTAQLLVEQLTAEKRMELAESNAPIFTVQLKDTELLADTYLRFMIKVRGDPKPTIAFFKDNKEITDDNKTIRVNRDHAESGYYELIIEKVRYEDVGTYKCVATNKFGTATSEAEVKVIDHKNIFGELENTKGTLESGEKPKFMWQRNGVYFEPDERFKVLMGDDEDSLALVFQHVKPEDAGLYTCVAQTSSGLVSCSAELTVQGAVNQLPKEPEAPKIVIEQKTFEVAAGGSAMLDLQVTGFPRPLVTWTYEGKPIEAGGKYKFLYEDAQNYTLVIKNASSDESGKYVVKAKNDLGTDTGEIVLDVKAPPKFKSKIQDASCLAGATVRIKMEIDGSPRPTLKIYRDGKEVEMSERIQIEKDGSTYTLVMKDTILSDSGSYSVVATNDISQASEFWKTTIYSPPKITKKLGANVVCNEKESTCFEIKVEADPMPECVWYKNNKEILNNTETLVQTEDEKGTFGLKITGAVSTDSARYKCVLKNTHGASEDSVRLDVRGAPVVRENLKNITVTEGDVNIELVARVDGFPRPSGRWFLGDVDITSRENDFDNDVDGDGNYKLIIKEANPDFHGKYTLKLTNDFGSTEDSCDVTINCKPQLLKTLSNTTVDEGQTLQLEIEVVACPEPEVKWFKNGAEVSADARIKITRDHQRRETYNLTVDLVKYEDGGEYEVTVQNALGVVSSKSTVTVHKLLDTKEQHEEEAVTTQKSKDSCIAYPIVDNIVKDGKPVEISNITEISRQSEITEKPEEIILPKPKLGKSKEVPNEALIKSNIDDKPKHAVPTENDVNKSNEQGLLSTKPKITEIPIVIERRDSESQGVTITELDSNGNTPEIGTEKTDLFKTVQKQSSVVEESINEEKEDIPSIIETNLEDQEIYETQDLKFFVKAFSNPPCSAEWFFNGKQVKNTKELKRIKHEGMNFYFETPNMKKAKHQGKYEIKLKNKLGEITKSAELYVFGESDLRKPKIIQGLTDIKVPKGQEGQMSCVITGDPEPEVIWYFKDQELSRTENITFKANIEDIKDGLKQCTFTIIVREALHADTGEYTIKASNQHGECESKCRMDVELKPELYDIKDVSGVPGDKAELAVTVHANPEPVITWTKDDIQLTQNDAYAIEKEGETCKYIIKSISLGDQGKYTVNASNELGEASATLTFNPVTQPPAFLTKLVDQIIIGDFTTATLHVRCEGLPKPVLQWSFNNQPIVETDRVTVETTSDAQVSSDLIIREFSDIDDGKYSCLAKNLVGEAETVGSTTIAQIPPSFGKKLEKNLEAIEGKPLELKLTIDGSPKPTVEWYKDGVKIPEDDDRVKLSFLPDGVLKLNIDRMTTDDSGAYKVIVKNNNGQIAAMCAVVVNQEPCAPYLLKEFENVSVPAYEPLKISAKIGGYPTPKVEWSKDGLAIRSSPSGLTTIQQPNGVIGLETDSAKPEQDGTYTCTISNKLGEIQKEIEVNIKPPKTKPGFRQELFGMQVVEGFPAKLEIQMTGHPTPSVKWLRNDSEIIPDGIHHKITQSPDGTCALLIDKCTIHDTSPYRVELENENGEASSKALLTIISKKNENEPEERPMFVTNLRDVTADEGDQLKITAPFHGNPIPDVQWSKDGEEVKPDERTLITCDGSRVGLEVNEATPADAGTYSCQLVSPLGEDQKDCKVTIRKVYQAPTFEQKFKDIQQLPTFDVKFPCRIGGIPTPEVTWFKDDKPLHETDKYHIKRDGDASCLYVRNCNHDDTAVYKCVAKNREGSASCQAQLSIVDEIEIKQKTEPPTFLKKIGDTELYKGMTAKFTACATGFPEPEVEWQKDGVKLYPSQRIRMEKDRSGLLRLTIEGIDTPDLGRYTCKIHNSHGEDQCEANLTFDSNEIGRKRPVGEQYTDFDKFKTTGTPLPLTDPPLISKMTDRHLTLSWKPSLPTGTPRYPVTYQVEKLDLPHGEWQTIRTGIRSCICGIPHLEPFQDYKFRIRVENKFGISDPSPFAVTYRQKLEPEPPKVQRYLPPGVQFHLEKSQYFPKDFDIERPLHGNMNQAPVFLRQDDERQFGVKGHNVNLFWFVYGYPKPKISYTFNDVDVELGGGRFDSSYTRNGQASLFINHMLENDVGYYEAIAKNEHGEARQRVRLEIAEPPRFSQRLDEKHVMLRKTVRLVAHVNGVPYPDLKWYKDWQPLANSSRVKLTFLDPDCCMLTINDVIQRDEGLYSLSASNVAGTATTSAMVYISEDEWDYNYYNYTPLNQAIKPRIKGFEEMYALGDELGRGTQGVTYHACERLTGRSYAAKIMHGRGDTKQFMHNELDIMNGLSHRKLIRLQDSFERDTFFMLVMELAGGGELVKDYLLKQTHYTESLIAGYVRQILYGLDYMHDKAIGHFGLTIGDLLLSHPGSDDLKICDFGLSRRITMGRLAPLHYGMPEYVSPETARGEGVGVSTDMWSLGIITYILLSGISPFRGANDRETLTKVRDGFWSFENEFWLCISNEGKDFIRKLLNVSAFERMDVKTALKHPWLTRADKIPPNEYRISTDRLRNYYNLYREWYDNASCRQWYRRNKLVVADDHPSKMVYPPGEVYTPEERTPEKILNRKPGSWETRIPERPGLDYEIGAVTSESHYQYGPDTYLLQLRDTDFPVRLREYMKVAASVRSSRTLSDSDYDWRTPAIHERRRFTDVMDEEIDDERKERISKYGSADTYTLRRLRHELGYRLGTYAEAEALIESKLDGSLPFFREKEQIVSIVQNQNAELCCFAVGDPTPVVQWFKNDTIIGENARVKITTDEDGRSILQFKPALEFDVGLYKIVARNKIGQTYTRTRVVLGTTPDSPDSPTASKISENAILLTWRQPKHDGYSPVLCYSLQYKQCDQVEWIQCADNIDHEFYLIQNLTPETNYIFRLAARNQIGWGEFGVPTAVIKTTGSEPIQLSRAMTHLQQLTDSGNPITISEKVKLDYSVEADPIQWDSNSNVSDKYNFISEIARGRFSVVVKGVNKETDSVVVGKLLECKSETVAKTEQEWNAWRNLRHERIASLLAGFRKPDGAVAALIQERLQGADVLTYLASRHEYSEQVVATIITQVIDGLQYLHWRGLCHLNIQPDNIVLATVRSVQVKLIDFGSAQKVSKLGTNVGVIDSHPEYTAPEILNDEPAFPQSDIWSVGVLTYLLLSGTSPFQGKDAEETKQNISYARYRFENLYKELSQEAVRFIMLIFKRNPNKRPTAEECHENRWFMPSDFMIKKRERAVFLGNRLKAYNEEYHKQKAEEADAAAVSNITKGPLGRSNSIQEELLTAP